MSKMFLTKDSAFIKEKNTIMGVIVYSFVFKIIIFLLLLESFNFKLHS